MSQESPYLQNKLNHENGVTAMQVVSADIVAYSRRTSSSEVKVLKAFMRAVEEALASTSARYVSFTQGIDVQLRRDIILVPAAASLTIAFPFDAATNMHLFFTGELFRTVSRDNARIACEVFKQKAWCNCHESYYIRCGVSEGPCVLYKDLNGNFNIAGDVANLSGRVMNLATASQVFVTGYARARIVDMEPDLEDQFRRFAGAESVKGELIDVYQYVDPTVAGLDLSVSDVEIPPVEPIGPREEPPSSVIARPKAAKRSEKNPSLVLEMAQRMVRITTGEARLGSDRVGYVQARVASPFLIDRYPVTQDLYSLVMGRNPSFFAGPQRPVDSVSWDDAIQFCNRLSELVGREPAYQTTGAPVCVVPEADGYQLPTELEWEYCCRAGTSEERYGPIEAIAWYNGNSHGETHDVGQMRSNGFGLYDMLGNVFEWCFDWYQKGYPPEAKSDYQGPPKGWEHVIRGGSWGDLPDCIRASFRHRANPQARESHNGMRVVLPDRQSETIDGR